MLAWLKQQTQVAVPFLHRDGFQFRVHVQGFTAVFASYAAFLHAAKGRADRHVEVTLDPDVALDTSRVPIRWMVYECHQTVKARP